MKASQYLTLSVLTGMLLVKHADAQTTNLNFLDPGHVWKTNMVLDTTAPGSMSLERSSPIGVAMHSDLKVPEADGKTDYRIGGTLDLRNDIGFTHGFFKPATPDLAVDFTAQGFGIEFINRTAAGADEVSLLVNGSKISLTGIALSFNFPTNPNATGFLTYEFLFTQLSRQTWHLRGGVLNNKGAPILTVDRSFGMNIFEAEVYGVQVQQLPTASDQLIPEVSNINGLAWRVGPVPEPSGLMLLAMGSLGLLLRRTR